MDALDASPVPSAPVPPPGFEAALGAHGQFASPRGIAPVDVSVSYGGAALPTEVARLQEHATYLQRKVRYVQSVSTIFRQRIALMLRAATVDPALRTMFAQIVAEATQAEDDFEAANAAEPSPARSDTSARAAAADARKAHQVCVVLREKNELRRELEEARARYAALNEAHEALKARHGRSLEAQGGAGAAALQSQRELYEDRVRALQAELDRKAHSAAAAAAGGADTGVEAATVAKQNTLLKARVSRLKEDAARQVADAADVVAKHNAEIEQLAVRCDSLQRDAAAARAERRATGRARDEAQAAVRALEHTAELLRQRVAELEGAQGKGDAAHTATAERAAELLLAEQRRAEEAERAARERGDDAARLQEELLREHAQARALGEQLGHLRRRVETFERQGGAPPLDSALEAQLHSAVADVRDAVAHQAAADVPQRLAGLQQELRRVGAAEHQLRLRDDELCLAREEVLVERGKRQRLEAALAGVSSLMLQLPVSVAALERMAVEAEVYKRAAVESAEAGVPVDRAALHDTLDLRLMEASAARDAGQPRLVATSVDTATEALLEPLPALTPLPGAAEPGAPDTSAADAEMTYRLFDPDATDALPAAQLRLCLAALGLPAALLPRDAGPMSRIAFVALCTQ